jgi:hypothetical protein
MHVLLAAIAATWAGAAVAQAATSAPSVLLVDDDESDNNNNAPSANPSPSDTFYRRMLAELGRSYDTFVVPRYADGPPLEQLKRYALVVWYTGASYGGNRDNTSVMSLKDEEALRQYVSGGGAAVVISPGYLNNALGAGGAASWEKKESPFLQQVLGIKGGRALVQRQKGATVSATAGGSFTVADSRAPETQFSALNPQSAQVVFTAPLDPDGKGARAVPVAVANAVGSGHVVYAGFTVEAVTTNPQGAFGALVAAAGASGAPGGAAQSSGIPRLARTDTLSVTGAPAAVAVMGQPRQARTETLSVTGVPTAFQPRAARTDTLSVTGVAK